MTNRSKSPRAGEGRDGAGGAGLPSWSIRRPIGTVMLTSAVVLLGLVFLNRLPLDLLPSFVYPQVRVNVNNPGVEPEVLEETVAKPLETALSTTENLTTLETEIQEGRVAVNLHFSFGTNVDFALQDAATRLERARSQLPEEAEPPSIFKFDPSQIAIYDAGFSSEARDLIDLRDWVENRLRPQLLLVDGVASVDVSGGLVREVQVSLDQERLRSFGLTVAEVIEGLRAANQDVAAGRVISETWEIVGKTEGKFRSVDQIREVLLRSPGGGRIPLSEVAEVVDTHREQRLWARLDGVPAVKVSVRKQPDANTVEVAEALDGKLRSLSREGFFPPDIEYRTIQNQATFIRSSIASVRSAALLGALMAMVMVLFFLGSLRKTLIIGLAIPIAILATFVMMGLGGLTLNIMSLGGLALGVGLLIDNSIVMLENIFRHREEGMEDVEEAAHRGAAEVQSAVTAATLTNLAAVVPFLLITGLAALIFRELILTISFAILASLGVALTLVPSLSAQLAKVRFTSGVSRLRPFRAFDRAVGRLRTLYARVAERLVPWRWAVLGAAGAALALALFSARDLGTEFLPQVDDGNVGVFLSLPPGSSAEETNRLAREVERLVQEMPDVETVFTTAGGFLFGGATSERAGRGNLDVVLAPAPERSLSADRWVQTLQARIAEQGFPGARIFVRPPRIRGIRTSTSGSAVSITVIGDDLTVLQEVGDEVARALEGVAGLENVEPSIEEASPELAIELDRERAAYLGLSPASVGQTLRTALDGTVATRYTEGNREYDVRVRLPRENFASPEDLASVALFPGGTGDAPIYVRDVARVYTSLGPTTIERENQNRVLRLSGDVITEVASVGEVSQEIRDRVAGLELPDGYGLVLGGEDEALRESNRQLALVILLAIFMVFVVMAVLYESVVDPLVILLSVPLSVIGVAGGLALTDTPLSAPVLLGVILLAGIVVNNAILLVEYAGQFRREGHTMEEAVVEAGRVRLRPILMTTITTGLGMAPLALGLGQGSELMRPLAIAVVGGLFLSAALTLFVVPSAYLVLNRGAERLAAWLTGARGGGEERSGVGSGGPAPLPAGD